MADETTIEASSTTRTVGGSVPVAPNGAEVCVEFLNAAGVTHTLIPHTTTDRARDEAIALGVPPRAVAKTLVLGTPVGRVRAVIPASERLSLAKVRGLVEGGKEIQLLDERELQVEYPMFELGAIPPFGGPAGDRVLVDLRLANLAATFVEAGMHNVSIDLAGRDLVAVTGATVGDVTED
jgi:prolyl-tRNA editing enzyme YbaK/EbsC (Cys-tRNA(Pro) deacylase)